MGDLLNIKNLRVHFQTEAGTVEVVSGVDINIQEGEIIGLVGESGSGKSISMRSVIGMLPKNAAYTADHIVFNGKALSSDGDFKLVRGKQIATIFQDPMTSLNPLKRVGRHITEVLVRHQGLSAGQSKKEAVSLFREVDIPNPEERLNAYPHELSGGQRQRVLIAMALACKPKLLIADEPTTALDVTVQAQILELIARLQREESLSVILITHNLAIVENMCQRVFVMYGGLIMEQAGINEIFNGPKHPYTQALLKSIPSRDKNERLYSIAGQPPRPVACPVGCPFAVRCARAVQTCFTDRPALKSILPELVGCSASCSPMSQPAAESSLLCERQPGHQLRCPEVL
jgi:oligopeptide/dipeptide ABC transporter ATP-binding protein